MAGLYEIGHAAGKKAAQTYEQGLASLADKSNLRKKRKQRMAMAIKIWNAASNQGLRGMQGAQLLKEVGFTNGEIKAVLNHFLNDKG